MQCSAVQYSAVQSSAAPLSSIGSDAIGVFREQEAIGRPRHYIDYTYRDYGQYRHYIGTIANIQGLYRDYEQCRHYRGTISNIDTI